MKRCRELTEKLEKLRGNSGVFHGDENANIERENFLHNDNQENQFTSTLPASRRVDCYVWNAVKSATMIIIGG